MPSLSSLALATLASFASTTLAGTIGPISSGPYKDVVLTISKESTLNSTSPANFVGGKTRRTSLETIDQLRNRSPLEARQSSPLTFSFESYPFGATTTINAYVSVTRASDNAMVFLQPNGQWYTPQVSNGQGNTAVPASSITISYQASTTKNVTLPGFSSGRVYYAVNGTLAFFANGQGGKAQIVQPSASNTGDASYNVFWGFTEFTYNQGGLNINPSAVDFAGCPNTFAVYNTTGKYQGLGNGLEVDAATTMCNNLKQQAGKDGQPWDQLCRYNNKNQLVRVLSPNTLRGGNFNNPNAFNGYFEPYVNQVWSKFSNQDLAISLSSGQQSTCRVSNNQLSCTITSANNEKDVYNKPATADIFSCSSGPFANGGDVPHKNNVAALCASFVRSTMLNSATQPTGPVSSYYANAPTNWYSYYAHNASFSGIGYAFPYDDVTPSGTVNQSGDLQATNPGDVVFLVGGFGYGGYQNGQYS